MERPSTNMEKRSSSNRCSTSFPSSNFPPRWTDFGLNRGILWASLALAHIVPPTWLTCTLAGWQPFRPLSRSPGHKIGPSMGATKRRQHLGELSCRCFVNSCYCNKKYAKRKSRLKSFWPAFVAMGRQQKNSGISSNKINICLVSRTCICLLLLPLHKLLPATKSWGCCSSGRTFGGGALPAYGGFYQQEVEQQLGTCLPAPSATPTAENPYTVEIKIVLMGLNTIQKL